MLKLRSCEINEIKSIETIKYWSQLRSDRFRTSSLNKSQRSRRTKTPPRCWHMWHERPDASRALRESCDVKSASWNQAMFLTQRNPAITAITAITAIWKDPDPSHLSKFRHGQVPTSTNTELVIWTIPNTRHIISPLLHSAWHQASTACPAAVRTELVLPNTPNTGLPKPKFEDSNFHSITCWKKTEK